MTNIMTIKILPIRPQMTATKMRVGRVKRRTKKGVSYAVAAGARSRKTSRLMVETFRTPCLVVTRKIKTNLIRIKTSIAQMGADISRTQVITMACSSHVPKATRMTRVYSKASGNSNVQGVIFTTRMAILMKTMALTTKVSLGIMTQMQMTKTQLTMYYPTK